MGLLQRLFGPSQAEIWQQLSKEIAATYVDGSFWNGAKVVAQLEHLCVIGSASENDPRVVP